MSDDRRRKAKPTREEHRRLLLETKRKALAGDTTAALALASLLMGEELARFNDDREAPAMGKGLPSGLR